MNHATQAAQLWARLEPQLSPFLREPEALEDLRAAIIRAVGLALDGTAVALPPEPAKIPLPLPVLRETPGHPGHPTSPPVRRVPLPHRQRRASPTLDSSAADGAITRRLDELLDQQCSRHSGYDGDDSVSYT